MKLLIPIFLILTLFSCKKDELNPTLTKEFSIQSVAAKAEYHIKIALPDNYNPSKQKYAAIYVLDGDENFNFVAEKCKEISSDHATSNIIVVSIGYGNDRTKDYTPTKAAEGEGGAENFMLFIKDELIPRIEADYGADTSRQNRIILGHSFGGLFAAYAFANFNEVFGNYIMLSPSIWYDDEIILRMEQEHRNINKDIHQLVFLGIGELESNGRMLAPYEAFHQRLSNNYMSCKIYSHMEPRLDHMGSKNPNILEGLNYYFQNK